MIYVLETTVDTNAHEARNKPSVESNDTVRLHRLLINVDKAVKLPLTALANALVVCG